MPLSTARTMHHPTNPPDAAEWSLPKPLPVRRQYIHIAPSLLLVFGPPVWQAGFDRGLAASASGQIDLAVLLKISVYALAGGMSTWQLVSWFRTPLVHRSYLPIVTACLLVPTLLYFSALNSPSRLLTIAMATLFSIGWFCALQLAVLIGGGRVQLRVAANAFMATNFLLLILILVTNLLAPETVGVYSQRIWRVWGNDVGSLFLCSGMVALWAGFLYVSEGSRWKAFMLLSLAAYGLVLSQVRMGVVALCAAMLVFAVYEARISTVGGQESDEPRMKNNIVITLLLFVPSLLLGSVLLYADELLWFITRDNLAGISTLSGRTLIWSWVSEHGLYWIGNGFVAGFREDFQSIEMPLVLEYLSEGLNIRRIGNAHSIIFEFYYGVGLVATIFITVLLARVMLGSAFATVFGRVRLVQRERGYVAAIALFCVLSALTSSNFVIPPGHPFGVFMYSFSLSLGGMFTRFGLRPLA